jgi:hypothetical protein
LMPEKVGRRSPQNTIPAQTHQNRCKLLYPCRDHYRQAQSVLSFDRFTLSFAQLG